MQDRKDIVESTQTKVDTAIEDNEDDFDPELSHIAKLLRNPALEFKHFDSMYGTAASARVLPTDRLITFVYRSLSAARSSHLQIHNSRKATCTSCYPGVTLRLVGPDSMKNMVMDLRERFSLG